MRRAFLAVVLALLATLAGAETLQVSIPSTQVVDDPASIKVHVDDLDNNPFILGGADGQSVTVTIGGVSGGLVRGSTSNPNFKPPCCYPIWLGSIDLSSLASGDYPIVATATNSTGQTFTASGTVTLDRTPRINVAQPAWSAETWLQVPVAATCSDDYGCTSITLQSTFQGPVLLSGVDSISGVIGVAPSDAYTLRITATDTRGQSTTVGVPIYSEGSPNLRPVATVPGVILDADATRILYADSANRLVIRDRASGADTTIHPAVQQMEAFLTDAGALIGTHEGGSDAGSYKTKSWENGALVVLDSASFNRAAKGRYVAWTADGGILKWRDVVAGDTRQVSANSRFGYALGPNGNVAFWQGTSPGPYELLLYDPLATPANRTVVPATSCLGSPPRTDGSSVVFRGDDCTFPESTLYAWKDGVLRSLGSASSSESWTFDVAGGWIGAAKSSSGTGLTSAWRFNAQGSPTAITGLGVSPRVEKVNGDGAITFTYGDARVIAPPSEAQVRDVGSRTGNPIFIGNALHVALGNALLLYDRAVPKVSATSLVFGAASMGMRTPAKAVVLVNDSAAVVTIQSVAASPGFAQSNDCATVAPGQSCTVQIQLAPPVSAGALGSAVNLLGTVTVTSTGATEPIRIALAGPAYKSLVPHFYQWILGRDADGSGYNFWQGEASRMVALGADLNEAWFAMTMAFFRSAEYNATTRTNAAYVTNLYNTFFSRAPDSGGLAYWTGQVDAGLPRDVALTSFMFSPEFGQLSRAIFGGGPARAEIDMVMDFYRGLLGRLPDTAGFNNWVGQFRAAQCQGESAVRAQVEAISSAFVGSGEYAARNRANPAFVGDLFNAFLRRGGDLDGVRFWIDQLNAGRTRDQIRRDFIASPEFSARVNAVVAQGCSLP